MELDARKGRSARIQGRIAAVVVPFDMQMYLDSGELDEIAPQTSATQRGLHIKASNLRSIKDTDGPQIL